MQEFEHIWENLAVEEEGNNADADNEGGVVYDEAYNNQLDKEK